MFAKKTFSGSLMVSLFLLPLAACNKPVDDATLATNVKSALAADSTIAQQPVQVAVQSGVVTLSGNVTDETASSVSAQDAAKVKGVKEVVNALTVAGMTVTPTVTSPAEPTVPRQTTASRCRHQRPAPRHHLRWSITMSPSRSAAISRSASPRRSTVPTPRAEPPSRASSHGTSSRRAWSSFRPVRRSAERSSNPKTRPTSKAARCSPSSSRPSAATER
jgi:hypothetical protein